VYFWEAEMLQFSALRRHSQSQTLAFLLKVNAPQDLVVLHSHAQVSAESLNDASPLQSEVVSQEHAQV